MSSAKSEVELLTAAMVLLQAELRRMDHRLGRAREAGRRLGAYWKTQCEGEEGLHEVLVHKWRSEGRLEASTFPKSPEDGLIRGSGPCRRCGLRAWRWQGPREAPGAAAPHAELRCLGCYALHSETWPGALRRARKAAGS